jgi:hypothetical protein
MKPAVFPQPLWAVAEMPAPAAQPLPRWGFMEWFVIGQTALPALLFFPMMQPLRLPIRIGAFGASLIALAVAWWLGRTRRHPSSTPLLFALAYLALMIFHPSTNTRLAGLAQCLLYLAVLAPAFWAPGLVRNAAQLRRIMWLLLILNGINSAVGVLQVYDPGTWMPRELTALEGSGVVAIRMVPSSQAMVLSYKGNNGETVIRPPGLFDSPGAVAGPGMYAGLIGLTFFVTVSGFWKKGVALLFSLMGVSVIYLTQVRTSLIVLGGMLCVYLWALLVRKHVTQAAALLVIAAVLIVGSFSLAISLGGGTIRDRVATLWSKNPADLYYANRGNQLESGFTKLLVEHPFGAGLARWGMMRLYFGDPGNLNSPPIWAEVQVPAWLLDGGFVLTLLYSAALITSLWYAVVLILRAPSEDVWTVAALVLAVNAGTVALTFGFTPFTTQHGLQYWLLSGALFGVAENSRRAAGSA